MRAETMNIQKFLKTQSVESYPNIKSMKDCLLETFKEDTQDDIDSTLKDEQNIYGDLKIFEYSQEICPE